MLEALKLKNPDYEIYSVTDEEFTSFGRIIKDIDVTEICEVARTIELPAEGSSYVPSEPRFEELKVAEEIKNKLFGCLPTEIGNCWGHSSYLNAAEWHTSSEINIATTDLVLFLGHIYDIKDGRIDSSSFKAFFVPAGTIIEVYATSLHFCPCETSAAGFGCVVGLPSGTNVPLEIEVDSPFIFRQNKWIISHDENAGLIARGVKAGIGGTNYKVNY